jgi:hypothetical protein
MFTVNEASNRGRYARIGRDGDARTGRARERTARTIKSLRRESATTYVSRGMRPLVRRSVASSVMPALDRIEQVMRDDERVIAPEAVKHVDQFLTEGATSPLFGDDPQAARRAAESLLGEIDQTAR